MVIFDRRQGNARAASVGYTNEQGLCEQLLFEVRPGLVSDFVGNAARANERRSSARGWGFRRVGQVR